MRINVISSANVVTSLEKGSESQPLNVLLPENGPLKRRRSDNESRCGSGCTSGTMTKVMKCFTSTGTSSIFDIDIV